MRCGAPAQPWRTTIASIPIDSIVCTVSSRLSPLRTDDVDDAEVHRVGREPPRRGLEREPGARRVLVEEVTTVLPAQRGDLRDVAPRSPRGTTPTRSSSASIPARPPRSSTESRCFTPCPHSRPLLVRSPDLDRVVAAVGLLEAAHARPRPSWSAGSCPRSRRGSAARGDHGRRAPRAARCAAGRCRRARRARRARSGRCRARRRRARRRGRSTSAGPRWDRAVDRPQADVVAEER